MAEIKDCCSCIYETRSTFTEPCVSCGFNFQNYVAKPEPKRKRKTNADRIRAMSDEELADWLLEREVSIAFQLAEIAGCTINYLPINCYESLLHWLKKGG